MKRFASSGGIITKILSAFIAYRRYPWAIVQAVFIGMLGHIGFVMSYYFASQACLAQGQPPIGRCTL